MDLEQEIAARLRTARLGRHLVCFESIGSTSEFLKRMAQSLPDGTAAVALEQKAGYGRQGNRWATAPGRSAEFSVLLRGTQACTAHACAALPLSLLCGLAVSRALDALCPPRGPSSGPELPAGSGFLVKWPNDIVCRAGGTGFAGTYQKVCGILCEARVSKELSATVCGIGINLAQDEAFFEAAGLPWGASVRMLRGEAPAVAETVAAVLNALEPLCDARPEDGAGLLRDYSARCVTLGREVRAHTPQGDLTGTAEGVGPDGSLLLRRGDGELTPLFASDVSVRGVMGYV